jgi:galacturan 1,4-alpha-galacturonidase
MNITNILFENFTGYSSGKNGRAVAKITCSTNPASVCENIQFKNFNITSPCADPPIIICDGVKGGVGMPCYSASSDEAKNALAQKCTIPQATASPFPVRPF